MVNFIEYDYVRHDWPQMNLGFQIYIWTRMLLQAFIKLAMNLSTCGEILEPHSRILTFNSIAYIRSLKGMEPKVLVPTFG